MRGTIIRLSSSWQSHRCTRSRRDRRLDLEQDEFPGSGSATGLGDILVRARYSPAAAAERRAWRRRSTSACPPATRNDLLGLGTDAGQDVFHRVEPGTTRFSPHVNIGYTLSGDGPQEATFGVEPLAISDEFTYAGGVEFVAHPRPDADRRHHRPDAASRPGSSRKSDGSFRLSGRRRARPTDFPNQTSTTNPLNRPAVHGSLGWCRGSSLNLVLGASRAGKFNAATRPALVSANVLFPLTDGGLRDTLAFTFGFDYAF